jgi:putative acetyltransferase
MERLLTDADDGTWPMAVLIGEPSYYRRFGFEPARDLGTTFGPDDNLVAPYMARRLSAYDEAVQGRFRYPWEL